EKFRPIIARLPEKIRGMCDLHFKGEGVFANGFQATASGTINDLRLPAAEGKELELKQAGASSSLVLDPNAIKWNDLKVSLLNWQLNSTGQISNWQKDEAAYEARVGGKLNDLKGFFEQVISSFLPDQTLAAQKKFAASKLDKISKAETSGQLGGSA